MIQRTHYALVLILVFASQAQAGMVTPTGAVQIIAAPPDVSAGALESNTVINAFAERQGVLLAADLSADVTVPGTSPQGGLPNLSPGAVPAGTVVNSYLLHFDSVAGTPQLVNVSGSISFTSDVLGIVVLTATLDATDSIAGLPATTYPTGNFRGLELNAGDTGIDGVTLSADRRTVSINLLNQNATEEVRIITAVPEPSSLVLAAIAAIAFLGLRRRCESLPQTA